MSINIFLFLAIILVSILVGFILGVWYFLSKIKKAMGVKS